MRKEGESILSKVLADAEGKLARTESLMKGLRAENQTVTRVEQEMLARIRSRRGVDATLETQMKEHRRRMSVLLKDADEVMRTPRNRETTQVAGLYFELDRCPQGAAESGAAVTKDWCERGYSPMAGGRASPPEAFLA